MTMGRSSESNLICCAAFSRSGIARAAPDAGIAAFLLYAPLPSIALTWTLGASRISLSPSPLEPINLSCCLRSGSVADNTTPIPTCDGPDFSGAIVVVVSSAQPREHNGQQRRAERRGLRGRAWRLSKKSVLDWLGLGGLLELLFHWLEGGSEHGGCQLGNVPAITDSGFNPFLNQPLLQFDELRRAFHCGQRLHSSGQVLGILGGQFLIRPGQLLNSGSRGTAARGQSLGVALHDFL